MKSLNKVLDVLEIFLDCEDEQIGLNQIAKLSGLNKATVHRIVSALVKRKYLNQSGSWGKYSLGTKFLNFSLVINRNFKLSEIVTPYLVKLNQLTQETVFLTAWDGEGVIELDAIESKHPLRVVSQEGLKLPLYYKAAGKIFLADMTEPELKKYYQKAALEKYDVGTIMDYEKLKKTLRTVALEGVANNDGESITGIRSAASAIRNAEGKVVASICLMSPSFRLTPSKIKKAVATVKSYALEISRDLGYKDSSVTRESGDGQNGDRENTPRDEINSKIKKPKKVVNI
jgi:DNA-binding IclR family transcriptional regulator